MRLSSRAGRSAVARGPGGRVGSFLTHAFAVAPHVATPVAALPWCMRGLSTAAASGSARGDHGAITLHLPGGLEIAGVSHGDPASPLKVLALHGWMDNAATHHYTAPAAVAAGFHVVAIDLPGHGLSSHRGLADGYGAGSYALAVMEVVEALAHMPHAAGGGSAWRCVTLLAHSMGAGISR
jgi:pimeloyl-ACP methyl ester carboxylesterase